MTWFSSKYWVLEMEYGGKTGIIGMSLGHRGASTMDR